MRPRKAQPKICSNGHRFYKSSDCPTCPVCEQERKPAGGMLAGLVAPARRALENAGVRHAADLSRYSEQEVLGWHGMGKTSLSKLAAALAEKGLSFRKEKSK